MPLFTAATLALALALQAAGPVTVDLICRGHGETSRMVPMTAEEKKQRPGMTMRREVTPVRGSVQMRIRPSGSTAVLPLAMGGIHGSGPVEISKQVVTADKITGKLEIALLYAPVFTINRVTGMLSIDGS